MASVWRDLEKEYQGRTAKSRVVSQRLGVVLPGGETREVTQFEPYPVALQAAAGCTILDVDGNQYRDLLNNYTSLVHGHGFAPVVEAIARAVASGIAFSGPHNPLVELAELVVNRYPAVEQVRFTNSGTEASLLALRIARRYTQRTGIVLFEGGYHGAVPDFMEGDPSVVRIAYNEANALKETVGPSTAAVFVEPFLGSGGVIPAEPGFLETIRAVSSANGALMVLDEVQSLRNSYSGVHGALQLAPDLVLMGKIIGGGTPVGAVGGRAAVLSVTTGSTRDRVVHSGTFNGNPLTMAAGLAAVQALDQPGIDLLSARGLNLATALEEAATTAGAPAHVTRAGSILQVHPGTVAGATDGAADTRRDAVAALHMALLLEGVYAAPRGMLNLSTAMDEADLQATIDSYSRAFVRVRDLWSRLE